MSKLPGTPKLIVEQIHPIIKGSSEVTVKTDVLGI
jgi:hypothetical protein